MPHGARSGLAVLVLCLTLGAPAVGAPQGGAGSTWSDPPARELGTAKPAAAAPQAMPAASSAPTPTTRKAATDAPRPARKVARSPKAAPRERMATRREALPRRHAVAAAPRPARVATARVERPRPPRVVAATPPTQDRRPYGYRPYGYGVGYGPRDADDHLERLQSAAEAGYLVVRRRSVEFPDGRSLRVYRPFDADGPY